MLFGNVDIPNQLVEASREESLVIFAGAGVSRQNPANLPSFDELINDIKESVDPGNRLREWNASRDAEKQSLVSLETPEQFLSYLAKQGKDVKSTCSEAVNPHGKFASLHSDIIRVFGIDGPVRLVTTNFDDCFENAFRSLNRECKIYIAPALPLGNSFQGLVHLHGRFNETDSMVLTAEDYGEAYVTNGWSSRFLVDLFKTYTVLFIGYSYGDSLIDYLTRSISIEITGKAFSLCKATDNVEDWQVRGIEPIVFNDFLDLPEIFSDWADCSETSVTDRANRIRGICSAVEMNQSERDFLIDSLQWKDDSARFAFMEVFCKASSRLTFLMLLKEANLVGFLIEKNPSKSDLLLITWAVTEFAINELHAFQEFCVEYINQLSPYFFERLFSRLITGDVPEQVIGSWISWLEFADFATQRYCEYELMKIAETVTSDEIALAALRILLRVGIGSSGRFFGTNLVEPTIVVETTHHGRDVLKIAEARSGQIGKTLFEYCCNQIERAYSIQTKYWTDNNAFDYLSYFRSSVAPHSQDKPCSGVNGILLDAARVSVTNSFYRDALRRCDSSNCALLTRLALWIRCEFSCSGKDLSVVRRKKYLDNIDLRHEAFALIKKSFSLATDKDRVKFVDYLRDRVDKGNRNSEYDCYNICTWLLDADVSCFELIKLRDDLVKQNPSFKPREHPDFTHYVTSGAVDVSKQCHISKRDFTNKKLLSRIKRSSSFDSFVTEYDIVAAPVRDYPDVAICNLRELLSKECSSDELKLMNLIVMFIEWGNVGLNTNELVELLNTLVADKRTCVAGIESVVNKVIESNHLFELSNEHLASIVLSALPNFEVFLGEKSAFVKNNQPDWVLMGINHPAGKYVELISEVVQRTPNEADLCCKQMVECIEVVGNRLANESDSAKCAIACIFARLNILLKLDSDCIADRLIHTLSSDDWAFVPAWQGLSYVPALSERIWNITRDYWPFLFANCRLVGSVFFEQLMRLYIRAITDYVEPKEKSALLIKSFDSKETFDSACLQLDSWLESLEKDNRSKVWEEWLSSSFAKLAELVDGVPDVLAKYYSKWIRQFPEMRNTIAVALFRDCAGATTRGLYIRNGTLGEIALDRNLDSNTKAKLLTFMLEHQRELLHVDDASNALCNINPCELDEKVCNGLKDAYTCQGLLEIVNEWDVSTCD